MRWSKRRKNQKRRLNLRLKLNRLHSLLPRLRTKRRRKKANNSSKHRLNRQLSHKRYPNLRLKRLRQRLWLQILRKLKQRSQPVKRLQVVLVACLYQGIVITAAQFHITAFRKSEHKEIKRDSRLIWVRVCKFQNEAPVQVAMAENRRFTMNFCKSLMSYFQAISPIT